MRPTRVAAERQAAERAEVVVGVIDVDQVSAGTAGLDRIYGLYVLVPQPEPGRVVVLLRDRDAISPAATGDPLDIRINRVDHLFSNRGIQRLRCVRIEVGRRDYAAHLRPS